MLNTYTNQVFLELGGENETLAHHVLDWLKKEKKQTIKRKRKKVLNLFTLTNRNE